MEGGVYLPIIRAKRMVDIVCLGVGGLALVASQVCFAVAMRRMDDIWHARWARASQLVLAGVLLLAVSAIMLWLSPFIRSLIA